MDLIENEMKQVDDLLSNHNEDLRDFLFIKTTFLFLLKSNEKIYYQLVIHENDNHNSIYIHKIHFYHYFQQIIHLIENSHFVGYIEDKESVMYSINLMFQYLMIMLFHLIELVVDQILEYGQY